MNVRFSKKIYGQDAIETAIAAFDGLARFSLADAGDYTSVEILPEDPDQAGEIGLEFKNYVLGETIAKRGVA